MRPNSISLPVLTLFEITVSYSLWILILITTWQPHKLYYFGGHIDAKLTFSCVT